ncbi:hypothetical protein FHT39_000923 [Mitsuaria sp. BK045]|nr:hypothetical protein [Mitsuaria sp. BK045]
MQQLIEVVHRGAPMRHLASLAEIEGRDSEMANIAPPRRNEKRPNTRVSAFEKGDSGNTGVASPSTGEHPQTDLGN